MIFASLILERDPLTLADLPRALINWTQVVGLIAAIALLLYGLVRVLGLVKGYGPQEQKSLFANYVVFSRSVALIFFVLLAGMDILNWLGLSFTTRFLPSGGRGPLRFGDYLFALVGALALFAVFGPFLYALGSLRWHRIWALARVSLKEAIRHRVTHLFAVIALIFLFAGWFIRYKPENQIRNYVGMLYFVMNILFLMVASLQGAFGIPTDVKNQSIHTIVTKPVEKFEIVLGRFLGYAILLTAGLAVVAGLSLIYVERGVGVEEEALRESYHARVPLVGKLAFIGIEQAGKQSDKGLNAGRTWDYRSYIAGPDPRMPNRPRQYAVWSFESLPAALSQRDEPVPVEFTFDIFRMMTGEVGKGIYCTFVFADGRFDFREVERRREKAKAELDTLRTSVRSRGLSRDDEEREIERVASEVAFKHGIHEAPGKEVTDYHTQSLNVPAGLFQYLAATEGERRENVKPGEQLPPQMRVIVSVDATSPTQMLGVARRDLYLLVADNAFAINFLKGVIGMWFCFLMILGVAVVLSTYLSGVISWLTVFTLYLLGMCSDFIEKLAGGQLQGGGPAEAFYRLTTSRVIAAPLDDSTTSTLLRGTDEVYRWFLRLVMRVLPDVQRFDLRPYVANGFDISWGQVLFLDNFVPLVGYLLPWAVLAYYFMKFREIANPT